MTPMNRTKFSGSGNIKHHSHSMSDRRGPAIFFLSSGSLIYHRRGLPLLITPCTALLAWRCPLVFNGQRGLLVISKRNLSCRDAAILIGNASKSGATTTWISWKRPSGLRKRSERHRRKKDSWLEGRDFLETHIWITPLSFAYRQLCGRLSHSHLLQIPGPADARDRDARASFGQHLPRFRFP